MSRTVVYTEIGPPEVLRVDDVDPGAPGPGQVRVRIEAAGVNPIDAKVRGGRRPSPPVDGPRRVGADGAGVIVAVGADVPQWRPGLPVAVMGATGTYADELTVSASSVFLRPAGVSAAQAAAVGIPVSTAYQALRSLAVGPDDTLLLHGGSGAVGRAAVQFAIAWGARVIATCSERRAADLHSLGAETVRYGDGLADRVRALAPAVSVALDAAGTDEALQVSLELVADRTRIATLVRGADADGLGIRAFGGGSPHPLSADELGWRREAIPVVLPLIAAGAFSVELGPSFPLEQAAEAHRLVEAGADGKIVLLP
ncbi:zinc-binding alcohol dehydrogenase family protein [Microbacterium sp. NPDC091313]